jgi:prepilin-type N-terminal cleavage/methylation domain-containing protein
MRKNRRKERSLLQRDTSINKGFTLIEMVLTVIILSILGAFTFSVIWQYSKIYADTRGGFIYGEAAAVMERITRELKDAQAVDPVSSNPASPSRYINFQLTHGTPGTYTPASPPNPASPPHWVQYCICSSWPVGGAARVLLYRVEDTGQGAADQCENACPTQRGWNKPGVMSRSIMSSHSSTNISQQGFRVLYVPGNGGGNGPEGDSYEITLALAANPLQTNRYDAPPNTNNPSIVLVSRVTPRNFCPYNLIASCQTCTGDNCASINGSDRAFYGGYYDEIK